MEPIKLKRAPIRPNYMNQCVVMILGRKNRRLQMSPSWKVQAKQPFVAIKPIPMESLEPSQPGKKYNGSTDPPRGKSKKQKRHRRQRMEDNFERGIFYATMY